MDNPYAPTDVAGPPAGNKTIRKIHWPAGILQGAALLAVAAVAHRFFPVGGLPVVLVGYVMYSRGPRLLLTAAHRRGMRLLRAEHFEDAIAQFEQSYAFFSRHAWIDRYRALAMFSPSAISYREMALCNIAHCYDRLGNAAATEAYLRRALAEFPASGLAAQGLKELESARQAGEDPAHRA